MNDRFVVIDIETTGQSVAQGDRIIEIGAVVIEKGCIVDTYSTLVNPERSIPLFIEDLTGITEEMVQDAPTFHSCIPTLLTMLEGAYFVAHNVQFDYSFLQKQLELEGYEQLTMPVLDTVELARVLLPSEESYKLSQLTEQLGFDHDRPHRAQSDAEVTGDLLLLLLNKLQALPVITLQQLEPLTDSFISDIGPIIEDLIQKKLHLHTHDEEKYDIYRQLALKKQVDEEEEGDVGSFSYEQYKEQLTQEDGDLARAFEKYEWRKGQLKMMDVVDEGFHNHEHLLIEAGTGTGKSLAYLVPSAFFAKNHQVPVVISTQTIPLQEQILERDIPLLKKVLPFPLKVALLKGRNHYLSLRKFEQSLAAGHHDDTYDTILTKAQILVWLTETDRGDREELNLPPGGNGYWYTVQSDAESSLGKYCPWFSRSFYQRARKKAQQADLIVTNHALLFTDMVQKKGLIPSYKQVVIDEAHHLEEIASDYLGMQTDYVSFYYLFQRIGFGEKEGVVDRLYSIATKRQLPLTFKRKELDEKIQSVLKEIDELFRQIHGYVLRKQKTSASDVGRLIYRYESYAEHGVQWEAILESTMRVHLQMKELRQLFLRLIQPFEVVRKELSFQEQGILADSHGLFEAIYEEEDKLYQLLLEADPNAVYWIEIEARGAKNATYLFSRPVEVGECLADEFFAKKHSVVMTSATLSIKGSFDYQLERLGLNDFGVKTVIIESPFDYERQARLLLPTDLPSIKDVPEVDFINEISIKLWRIADASSGRVMVLFTSFEMLRQVYQNVKDLCTDESFVLIGQGISSGSRARLMKSFKQHERAILFGTSSFWEGIDLPGDELRVLVIVRLPFLPPDQPLIQARMERIKEEGKNPFMHVSLPQAIIRFKQGFGRLIRTADDKGAVFVLDKRISTTRYGRLFIESLPNVPVHKGKLESLIEHYGEWL
ncbi:ATP-dependent DNA helicase DinG [Halalkalibacterium ligniniphilum]|uniref:ATP-dependent DNA helicase DinG n=1 Tax=Halalkalibacterium ligniniphilum TaxID=1134413 RepID=UPI0003487B37|nr:ATP-dependent DNA helicase DinG [Halalkalibacterium ligniniphilum]